MKEMKGESLKEIVKGILFDIRVLKMVPDNHRNDLVFKYAEARSITEEDIINISNKLQSDYDTTIEINELRKIIETIMNYAL